MAHRGVRIRRHRPRGDGSRCSACSSRLPPVAGYWSPAGTAVWAAVMVSTVQLLALALVLAFISGGGALIAQVAARLACSDPITAITLANPKVADGSWASC